MNIKNLLLEKVNYAIQLSEQALNTRYSTEDSFFIYYWVKSEPFKEFEAFSLSFILSTFGNQHPYYEKFKESVSKNSVECVESGKGLLTSIKTEIENWVNDYNNHRPHDALKGMSPVNYRIKNEITSV